MKEAEKPEKKEKCCATQNYKKTTKRDVDSKRGGRTKTRRGSQRKAKKEKCADIKCSGGGCEEGIECENKQEETADETKEKDKYVRALPTYFTQKTEEQKAAFEAFAKATFAKGVAGLAQEYATELKNYVTPTHQRTAFDQNMSKNRYKDVICNDLTRVVLNDGLPCDYVHANWVRGEPLFNDFICTQGPMPGTVYDFWRLVWVTRSMNIVMLCDFSEDNKVKCEKYYPMEYGTTLKFGDISVLCKKLSTKDPHITVTWLVVSRNDVSFVTTHRHWKTWPDRSIPKSTKAVMRILFAVRNHSRPTIVHCSAGVGRTGSLVAVEMCLHRILAKHELNILEICKKLRDQRMNSIQVDLQFCYLAHVVIEYGTLTGYCSPNPADAAKFKADLELLVAMRAEKQQEHTGDKPATPATPTPAGPPPATPTATQDKTPCACPKPVAGSMDRDKPPEKVDKVGPDVPAQVVPSKPGPTQGPQSSTPAATAPVPEKQALTPAAPPKLGATPGLQPVTPGATVAAPEKQAFAPAAVPTKHGMTPGLQPATAPVPDKQALAHPVVPPKSGTTPGIQAATPTVTTPLPEKPALTPGAAQKPLHVQAAEPPATPVVPMKHNKLFPSPEKLPLAKPVPSKPNVAISVDKDKDKAPGAQGQ